MFIFARKIWMPEIEDKESQAIIARQFMSALVDGIDEACFVPCIRPSPGLPMTPDSDVHD